jgi:hypothetical protein
MAMHHGKLEVHHSETLQCGPVRTRYGARALQLVLLELNEVNFDHLSKYAKAGDTPNLRRLIDTHGIATTRSEQKYERVEPWIQWVTAHTGMAYEEHGIFRLGDIVNHEIRQIWEHLEASGLRIGAISPMNAKNRTADAAFFLPDPWTPTSVTGGWLSKRLHSAITQAVNDNAQARVTTASAVSILAGLARYGRPVNYGLYARFAATISKPWRKAMFLDLLFGDVFIREMARTKPQFASLFLNGAAHIQHHYMFNSRAYSGTQKNPEWYVAPHADPVGEVYRLYDRIVGQVLATFPGSRVLIATGLHQDPHDEVTFYWRLKDHAAFLRKLSIPFDRVEARMSRDFLVRFKTDADAQSASRILGSVNSNGIALFDVDNRGHDLFATLTWPHDVAVGFQCNVSGVHLDNFHEDVAFVAIKNGEHNGIGYFIDTETVRRPDPESFELKDLPQRICTALGTRWTHSAGKAA